LNQHPWRALIVLMAFGLGTVRSANAQETIPLTFRDGDVISAAVINNLLGRLDDATSSVTTQNLAGSWNITQIVPYNGQPGNGSCRNTGTCLISGTVDAADGLSRSRTAVLTVTQSGGSYTFSQDTYSSFVFPHTNDPISGNVGMIAETAIFKASDGSFAYYYARKKNDRRIVLQDIMSGSNSFNMVILDKRNTPPTPVNALAAVVSSQDVQLSWIDQSPDESGFKIQRKGSVTGEWGTVAEIASNATGYTHVMVSPGTYWYRVLATNAHGDSSSSSEVRVVVQ
jgi:hypothetical protein